MRKAHVYRVILAIGCVFLVAGMGLAEDVADSSLPEYTGIPMPELAPWAGLEGGDLRPVGVIDDFNRPDGPLGADWTVQANNVSIVNEAATGENNSLVTHNSATGDHVEFDVEVDPAGGTQYAAAILNYGGGATNLFIKIQNNNSASHFNRVFCYIGNNDSAGQFNPYIDVSEVFTTARMAVTVDSSRDVTIDFTNVDGGALADQHYICYDAPPAEGPALGIGTHGNNFVRIDNFGDGPVPVELMGFSVE